ncbi:MAG: hypothetical protein ABSB25_06355 [Sedimentisphaerales bacterium]
MKKLSALFVILVMLGICTSSYGYFLVYKLSGTIRGITYNRSDTNTMGIDDTNAATISFKGCLVMNLDNDTNSLIDANMIIYGKDPNGHKVYVQLNASDSNGFLDPNILTRGNKRHFYKLNGKSPFEFNVFMMGNVRSVNIGLVKRILIAPDLKGSITEEDGIFLGPDQNITGVGSISASIYTIATKGVNDLNNPDPITPHTQDGIIDALKGIGEFNHKYYDHILEGYTAVSIPAP